MNKRKMLMACLMTAVLGAASSAQANTQYVASDSWTVGPGDYITEDGIPGCGDNSIDWMAEAGAAVAATEAGGVYGAIASVLNTAAKTARPETAGFIGQVLDEIYGGERYANCVTLGVAIPAAARIERIEYFASDESGSAPCFTGQDCGIGWSRFDPPVYRKAGQSSIVASNFRNWSDNRTREVTMTVYFVD